MKGERPERLDRLADALFERIADRVVERMNEALDDRERAVPPSLLDAKQAASYLGVDVRTVYDWARSGRLPAVRLGDGHRPLLRFNARELAEFPLGARSSALPVTGATLRS
jgi:excisionase family DNA binding protein